MRYLLGVKMLGSDFKIRWKGDKSGQIVQLVSIFLRFFFTVFVWLWSFRTLQMILAVWSFDFNNLAAGVHSNILFSYISMAVKGVKNIFCTKHLISVVILQIWIERNWGLIRWTVTAWHGLVIKTVRRWEISNFILIWWC